MQVHLSNASDDDYSFLSFVHQFLPRLSHADTIVLSSYNDDDDQFSSDQVAIVIGRFVSHRRSAESVQTLTINYLMESYRYDVGGRMKDVMPGSDVGDYWVCENLASIKSAVGPALVAVLDECDAVVKRLERKFTRAGPDELWMIVKCERSPDIEFRIALF